MDQERKREREDLGVLFSFLLVDVKKPHHNHERPTLGSDPGSDSRPLARTERAQDNHASGCVFLPSLPARVALESVF